MAIGASTQSNVVANPSRHLIFFQVSGICYNYKTNQWTRTNAYDSLGIYGVDSKTKTLGLVRFSSGSVDLQDQVNTGVSQTSIFTTGATDANEGGRMLVDAVRPLANGGTNTVRIGVQDSIDDSVTWSTGSALNSRTNKANFRAADNYPEGQYIRTEITLAGGFTTFMGADIDFTETGEV